MATISFGTDVSVRALSPSRSIVSGALEIGRGGGARVSGLVLQVDELNSTSDSPFLGWTYPGIVQIPGGLRLLDIQVPVVTQGFTLIRFPTTYTDTSMLGYLQFCPAPSIASVAINVRAFFVS